MVNKPVLHIASYIDFAVKEQEYENLDKFDIIMEIFKETMKAVMFPVDMARAVSDINHSDIKTLLYYLMEIISVGMRMGKMGNS